MKTRLLKTITLGAMFALIGFTASAQSNYPTRVHTSATAQTSDYVTVGSRMPYYVTPDVDIDALISITPVGSVMKASKFKWQIFDNSNNVAAATIKDASGAAITAGTGSQANYYDNNEITVSWSATAALTAYRVEATEHSVPGSGVFDDGCTGSTEKRYVYVLPAPSIGVNSTSATLGCGTASTSTYYIPVTTKGIAPWTVSYTIAKNGGTAVAASSTIGSSFPQTITTDNVNGTSNVYTVANTANILNASSAGATAGIPITFSGYGKYDVVISNVTDKISEKSLDAVAGTVTTSTITIYIAPTPVTGKVQHLAN